MFRTALSLDRPNRASTAVAGAVIVAGVVFLWSSDSPVRQATACLLVATFAIAFAMSPRALVVDDGEVRIERRFWRPLRLSLSNVEGASPIATLGKRVLRMGGVGGYFGSFGLFRSEDLGWFRLYSTRRGQAVVIARSGKLPVVVTPDDVAGAIDAIDPRAHGGAYRRAELLANG